MDIIGTFYDNKNDVQAEPMAKYMKNNFLFLGIKTPERRVLAKDFFNERKKDDKVDWGFIFRCYDLPEREFQYLAIGYLNRVNAILTPDDMGNIEKLIVSKSWWDSVDSIAPIVGQICTIYPKVKEEIVSKWIYSNNIWLNRVSIIFQLGYKEKTDTKFLKKAILANSQTNEFFINKAIGWALREYSKTNKEWVRDFIENNKLSKLSVREGGKYI